MTDPTRSVALRANCHAEQKRGGLPWSACDSKRGTTDPPRSVALRANYHAAPRRALLPWSACDSGAEWESDPRSATLRALPCGAPWSLRSACAPLRAHPCGVPWSLRSACAPLRAHPCGSPSVAAAAKAAPDRGVGAAEGGGGASVPPTVGGVLYAGAGGRGQKCGRERRGRGAGIDSPRTPPPLSPSPRAGGGYFM